MIKIVINNNLIRISGHANYDDYGKDIVCASVSSIIITSINAIYRFNKDAIEFVDNNDVMEITKLSEDSNVEKLLDDASSKIVKLIYQFEDTLIQVTDKNEPYILSRYLIDVAKAYSNFYNENKIIVDDKELQNARVYLTYAVGSILKTGCKLLGIEMPDKM